MKWMKAASLLLVLAMLLSVLSACGGKTPDPVREALGYSKDTTFFTVNGEKISAEDYLIWLVQEIEYINSYYTAMGQTGVNWDEDLEGVTAKEYIKEQAKETAKLVAVMRQMADDKGFRYDAEDEAAYEEERAAVVEEQGGKETYDRFLLEMCMTDASMERINRSNVLYRKMLEGLFSADGEFAPSEASIREELDARNILRAKHILLLTAEPDLDAKPYPADQIAAQRALANELLGEIRAADDPVAAFERLMNEYSEDTGLAGNPNGYTFTTMPDGALFSSRMVEEFENGTMALAIGQIGDVVESKFGLHIILRLDPTEDAAFMENFLSNWNSSRLDQMLQEEMNSAAVEETEAFRQLDAQSFYETLLAYRAQLGGEDAATAGDQAAPEAKPEEEGES